MTHRSLPHSERRMGDLGVELLAICDPHLPETKAGRLIAFELRLRHRGGEAPIKVAGSKAHLFDDEDHVHEALVLDRRQKAPKIVEGYLAPGGAVRGWITFALPLERAPKRLQLFSGYLNAEVVAWDLDEHRVGPALVQAALAAHHVAQRRAEVEALEVQAALAQRLETYRDELDGLNRRAAEVEAILSEATSLREAIAGIRRAEELVHDEDERPSRASASRTPRTTTAGPMRGGTRCLRRRRRPHRQGALGLVYAPRRRMVHLDIESHSEVDEVSVDASRASRWKNAAVFTAAIVLLTVVGGFLMLYLGVMEGAVTGSSVAPEQWLHQAA